MELENGFLDDKMETQVKNIRIKYQLVGIIQILFKNILLYINNENINKKYNDIAKSCDFIW